MMALIDTDHLAAAFRAAEKGATAPWEIHGHMRGYREGTGNVYWDGDGYARAKEQAAVFGAIAHVYEQF